MPDSGNVIRLENISQVYVSEREASLAIEDVSLGIGQGSLSVWSAPAAVAKQRYCPSSPDCFFLRKERLRWKAVRFKDLTPDRLHVTAGLSVPMAHHSG